LAGPAVCVCGGGGGRLGLAGEAAPLLVGYFGFVRNFRVLSGLARQAVQLQAAAGQYAAVVVFSSSGGDFDIVSGSFGELAGGLLMNRHAALVTMLFAASCGGGHTPPGQPALLSLDAGNFSAIKDNFNSAPRSVRLIALLSPT
jgi:hypothetical protein